jgi:predicted nucleic acid-binding protein
MHLALIDLFQAKWSATIHEEWIHNVLKARPDIKREQLERTRSLMDAHVLDCLVTGYEPLIERVTLPDAHDRHVLAAAITGKADLIITFNLKDFPQTSLQPYHIEAWHPDAFITWLISIAPMKVCLAARRHRASLKNPHKSVVEYLDILTRQGLPRTVAQLQKHTAII